MSKFSISIYPNRSEKGIELAIAIVQLIGEKKGVHLSSSDFALFRNEDFTKIKKVLHKKDIDLTVHNRFVNEIGQLEFLNSCLNDDIVIFDATREGENNSINNFDIANEYPKSLDRIWVVSRNYLPINFYGVDDGGYPDYGTAIKSNAEIIDWVSKKLDSIDLSHRVNPLEKGVEGFEKAANRTIEQNYRKKNEEINVFISFRTRYQYRKTIMLNRESFDYLEKLIPSDIILKLRSISNKFYDAETNEFSHEIKSICTNISEEQLNLILTAAKRFNISEFDNCKYSLKELFARVEQGLYHNGKRKTSKYLEDGSLVYSTELNTKQRTWQLLSIIDREYIMHCDELWIYGTDDYLDSWWTRGELLIYAFLLHQNIDKRPKNEPRKLVLYNPYNDTIKAIKSIEIDDYIAHRLTRIQSNCAPGVMGYESVKTLRIMRNLLYGNDEQRRKALDEYFGLLMQSIVPLSLKEQGMEDEVIDYIMNNEDAINEVKAMFQQQFEDLKVQLVTGNVAPETRESLQSMLSIQNEFMPEDMRGIISEDDIINTTFSEKYLKDEVFSEDFWETVIYQQPIPKNEQSIETKLRNFEKTISEFVNFSDPKHIEIGNIEEMDKSTVLQLNGKNILRRPSRFLFMPSRAGNIDLSPSKNNLQELPVFIIEN